MLTENTDSGGGTRSVLLALQPTRVPRSERRRLGSLALLEMVTTPERSVLYQIIKKVSFRRTLGVLERLNGKGIQYY